MEKYNQVFMELFSLEAGFDPAKIVIKEIVDWDSVGHMELITQLEDTFDIMFETGDILALDSYEKGIELLKKYGVEL